MAEFTFKISRRYTITESFERTFTADSLAQAQGFADLGAFEGNSDCPDDCTTDESGFFETSSFVAERIDLNADAECAAGLHSWTAEVGKLPADTKCTRCDERYGSPD